MAGEEDKKDNFSTVVHLSDQLTNKTSKSALSSNGPQQKPLEKVNFGRHELNEILNLYGQRVAEGEWRDYAMDFQKDKAVFSIFKRSSEMPLYRIEKYPKLSRKQGAYSVINSNGLILKRGHDLKQVLKVLALKKHLRIVD